MEKLLLALEERRILQIAPTVVTVFCQVPDNKREVRDKLIWDMIQFAKSIGISWLMESNAADARKGRNDNDHIHVEAVGPQGESKKASDSKGNFSTQPDSSQNSDEDATTGKRQVHAKATANKADDHIDHQLVDNSAISPSDRSHACFFSSTADKGLSSTCNDSSPRTLLLLLFLPPPPPLLHPHTPLRQSCRSRT